MPDETPTEGEMVPPIVDYEPETVEADPDPQPTTPPTIEGPTYPVPGEVVE